MTARRASPLVTALAIVLCFSLGCVSKSSTTQASVESSSKSLSSPFKWSSSSSSDDDEQTQDDAYRRDVRDYATSFGVSDGDARAFQRDLSEIAETHGVMDWENHEGTYLAIGGGLARADLDNHRFERLAIELANEDFARLALLQAGYEASREVARRR